MDEELQALVPAVATLFVFILVSNLIGYIPLPWNSETFKLFGANIPSLQIYAAETNVALPLMLTLGVFVLYTTEGVRAHGPIGYLKSLIPEGVGGPILGLIFPMELLSNFLRLISLTIRLWANLLAGHLLIDFMAATSVCSRAILGLVHCCHRGSDLPVRGGPDRRPAGLHLRHLDRHLPRRSGRKSLTNKELSSDAVSTPVESIHPRCLGVAEPSSSRAGMPGARSRSASEPVAAPPVPGRASARCSTT